MWHKIKDTLVNLNKVNGIYKARNSKEEYLINVDFGNSDEYQFTFETEEQQDNEFKNIKRLLGNDLRQ